MVPRYVDISKLSFTFPYGYNFAAAFNEEFVTCFKWIKKLHASPIPSPRVLWADILIKVIMIEL